MPEPKTGKNRIHWDITAPSVEALVATCATVLRPKGDAEIGLDDHGLWDLLALQRLGEEVSVLLRLIHTQEA